MNPRPGAAFRPGIRMSFTAQVGMDVVGDVLAAGTDVHTIYATDGDGRRQVIDWTDEGRLDLDLWLPFDTAAKVLLALGNAYQAPRILELPCHAVSLALEIAVEAQREVALAAGLSARVLDLALERATSTFIMKEEVPCR